MPTPAAIAGLSKPGDYVYPQYSRTYTRVLSEAAATGIPAETAGTATVGGRPGATQILGSSGVGLKKGELYTTDNTGAIYAWNNTMSSVAKTNAQRDVVEWSKGIFQALDDVPATGGSTKTAQFMGRGSRILHAVQTGTSVGDLVRQEYTATISGGNSTKNAFLSPIAINTPNGKGIINTVGTVIEIRSGETDQTKKQAATADTDLAVIEIGGF